jgi:prephenate dehydrogenase
VRLVGVDVDAGARQLALARNVVDATAATLVEGVDGADLVILATPVSTILDLLAVLPAGPYTVLDLGSTKAEICQILEELPAPVSALGGHPMCGKETAGLAAADARLYRGATFVLCRTARTTPAAKELVLGLVAALGARPLFLDPAEHDDLVGLVSHLPYLVSSLLMAEVAAAARVDDRVWPLSASGFRDTTRLAGSDPQMLRDIILTNRPAIISHLRAYEARLAALRALLEQGSDAELESWLRQRRLEYLHYRQEK